MKHFSRALVWLTLSEIIFNLAGYVIHASLGRILGPEDYGRFGIVVTLTTMIIVLIGNGVPTAMSKYLAEIFEKYPERVSGIKWATARLQALIMLPVTIIFYLLAPFIATLLNDSSLTPLFKVSAFIIPGFALASFYFYYYTGLHYFRLQAALKSFRALARIFFIIGFGYFFGVTGAVSGYIIAPLAVFLVAFLYDVLKVTPNLPSQDHTFTLKKKELFTYAWPFTLFLIFYELVLTADLYFVKALLQSDYLTGLYNAAITVGRIPYYLFYALTIILLPAIAKAKSEESSPTKTKELIHKTLSLIYVILFPMVSLLFVYSQEVMQFFYGQKYLGAIPAFEIFVFGAGLLTIFYVLAFALHGAGRTKVPMLLSLLGVILLVALNLSLIPRYQLVGAALAVTLTSLFLATAVLYFIKEEFSVSLLPKLFSLSLGSTLFISALGSILPGSHLLFILWGIILFGLHFFFLLSQGVIHLQDFLPKKKL